MRRALVIGGALSGLCAASACRQPPAPTDPDAAASAPPATAAPNATSAAPPPPAPLSPEAARRLAKPAVDCLGDPRCTVEEAARLYTDAFAAGAIRADCFDLYYGSVIPPDPARARACFERKVAAEKPCDGGSPSLDRTFLGLMLFDAQGGPQDRERGHALFVGCLANSDFLIADAAEKREKTGGTKPVDFCADIGGTTIDQTECARIDDDRAGSAAQKVVKELFAALAVDDAGFALWSQAQRAWERFAASDASYVHDRWRGGTGAPTAYELTLGAHTRERPEVLRALLDPPATPDPPAQADDALKQAEAAAGAGADAARKKLLADAQAQWRAYRTAEVAFVRHAFAKRHAGEDAAASAARAALTRRRAAALHKPD